MSRPRRAARANVKYAVDGSDSEGSADDIAGNESVGSGADSVYSVSSDGEVEVRHCVRWRLMHFKQRFWCGFAAF